MKKHLLLYLLLCVFLSSVVAQNDFTIRMEQVLANLEEREQLNPWEQSDRLFEINDGVMEELVELLQNPLSTAYLDKLGQYIFISHSSDSVVAVFALYENHTGTCKCCINIIRYRLPNGQIGVSYMSGEREGNYNCHSSGEIITLGTGKEKMYLSYANTRTCSTCTTEQMLLLAVTENGLTEIQEITINYRGEDGEMVYDPATQTLSAKYKLGEWDHTDPCDWEVDSADSTIKWCHFEQLYRFDGDIFVEVPASK